jgi:C4-dicarboxylate-specific signal transduction histidine kinase
MLRDAAKDRYELEDLPEDAKEIVDVVNKMASVVDHLRTYARRPDEKPRVEVDVNACVTAALTMLEGQLSVQGVRLRVALDSDLPVARGEPNSLEQVFLNLMTNSRDALQDRKESGEELDAELHVRSFRDAEHVVVEVRDNAGGIPDEIRDRVFDPFFTTKEAGAGTGLGLSIVQRIVTEHHGRVELDVEPAVGTTVRVVLPLDTGAKDS